jgi:glucose-1-phosphate cytidylyltransferase
MKVVLFCGGYGMRMRNGDDDTIPKPMQMIGSRPLIWHVMRYYAHFGHKDFILCLGYGAIHIKNYFLTYQESVSNDFVIRGGKVDLLQSDISDWSITFVDTGPESPIGERLRRVRQFVEGEEYFLANYSDVLTDAPMNDIIDDVKESGAVTGITPVSHLPIWENGGYFVLSGEVLDMLTEDCDLVEDVCGKLAVQGKLYGHKHLGFWKPADTFKERADLEAAYKRGDRPWMLWEHAKESREVAAL